jgi:hypothetical protein
MVRHHHVSDQQKAVSLANLSQRVNEHIPCANRSQQRQTSVTTEREEMQIPTAVIALQLLRHEKTTPRASDADQEMGSRSLLVSRRGPGFPDSST